MFKIACIPALNEAEKIGDFVTEMLQYVDDVIVCDDGSTDDTAILAEKAGAYVIKHSSNNGKGAALKSLFKYVHHSNAEIVVTIDGDGQFLPEEIPKICKPIEDGNSEIVIGYRFDNDEEMPSYRKAGNKFLDKLSSLAAELPFRDTQSGFRAYSRNAIEKIKFSTDGFGADSEILIDAAKKGLIISEEKVTVIYNTGSKTSSKHPIAHGGGVMVSLIELILIKHPLKFLGLPGIIILIVGMITSVQTLSIFNELRYFSIPFTLLAMGFLAFGITLILVSGILFTFNRQIRHS